MASDSPFLRDPGIAIAIDGPVASGKTAVGRLVAERLGVPFLDTGMMYRAITLRALGEGVALTDADALAALASSLEMRLVHCPGGDRLYVGTEDVTPRLREPAVEQNVSVVSRLPPVRRVMVKLQRAMAGEGPVVMAGRDIGTVVLPDAPVKVFLKASPEVRIRRRFLELVSLGRSPVHRQVAEELASRDAQDQGREDSPLRPADDAVQIDTDGLNVEDVAQRVLALAQGKR